MEETYHKTEEELISQLKEIFHREGDIHKCLALLVDTLNILSSETCAAYLISQRNGLVYWDYSKGRGLNGSGILPTKKSFEIILEGSVKQPFWEESKAFLKYYLPLGVEDLILLKIRKGSGKAMEAFIFKIISSSLAHIAWLHNQNRLAREDEDARYIRVIADTLKSVSNKELALNLLAASVCKTLWASRVAVLVFLKDSQELRVGTVYGELKGNLESTRRFKLSDGIAGWSLYYNQSVNIQDAKNDPRFIAGYYNDIETMICSPVSKEDRPMGTICAVNKLSENGCNFVPFTNDDENFLNNLGREVAQIFNN